MRLAEREAVLKKRLDDKLNERLREARAEVDAVVADLKTRAGALVSRAERQTRAQGPALSTGEVGGLRADARAALDTIGASVESIESAADERHRMLFESQARRFVICPHLRGTWHGGEPSGFALVPIRQPHKQRQLVVSDRFHLPQSLLACQPHGAERVGPGERPVANA